MLKKDVYKVELSELIEDLRVNPEQGFTKEEVINIEKQFGKNELEGEKRTSLFKKFISQFKDFMVIILLVAAIISGIFGELKDTFIIGIVVLLNAILGLAQESKAEKSLDALKNMTIPISKVLRDGRVKEINSKDIVPGDIVILEAGDYVPADGRIVENASLKVEESALTGESLPVSKDIKIPEGENIPIGDRNNMVFSTSMVTHGRGKFIVTSTGMNTEIGKIAHMIKNEEKAQTPLQQKLEELGKWLGILALLICLSIFVLGYFQGRPPLDMFMLSVSLAVAAIPEGLPAIVTIVLSLGVQRMIKKNAIIRRLPAVETLGSASVICSDKTGTLTQNKMTATVLYTYNKVIEVDELDIKKHDVNLSITASVLCNDATIEENENEKNTIGDPTEVALIVLGYKKGLFKKDLESEMKRVREIPFDSNRKLMSTIHSYNGDYRVFTKGAPDVLLDRCSKLLTDDSLNELNDEVKKEILEQYKLMASEGLRVLAIAYKDILDIPDKITTNNIEKDLVFTGLIGMIDPPRDEVRDAVLKCKNAGIKPVMITGDYKITAITIGKNLKILNDEEEAIEGKDLDNLTEEELSNNISKYSIFARVSPEHKVRIVKAWQNNGNIVAMTGDGVNDAPSLKSANIGCAMGITGTDVSKEASDMILTDDNFSTIVSAVEEGRSIYDNIKKSIHYLLSCNIGEIIALFVAILLNLPSPLLPIHILWINLVTDSFPALSLGVEPSEKNIMERKPRDPGKSIFSEGLGLSIVIKGIIIGTVTLLAFNTGRKINLETGRTMAFITLSFSQFGNSLSIRSLDKSLFKIGFFTNKYLIGALSLSTALMLSVIFIPFLREIFELTTLAYNSWIYILLYSMLPLILGELYKKIINK